MKTIYKFVLEPITLNKIDMPIGAEILSVAFQRDNFCMWAKVDTEATVFPRIFRVFGTGYEIPMGEEEHLEFVGTAHMDNGLVFHAFELVGL